MKFRIAWLNSSFPVECWRTVGRLSAYIDGALPHADRRAAAVHLRECRSCSRRYEELTETRNLVRQLPSMSPPAQLASNLKQIAGRESAKQRETLQSRRRFRHVMEGLRVRLENAMRPLAIPFAGGIVSAMVLASMLVPAYSIPATTYAGDVPTVLYTDPSVKSIGPFGLSNAEVIVEVWIDENGQVVDYKLPAGMTHELRSEIENHLLFAQFTPAMSFGQPTAGRIRVSFCRRSIDVKG